MEVMKITRKYVTNKLARSRQTISKMRFLVAHDTGNEGATAENHFDYFQGITFQSSAHTFIDDKQTLEIIPLNEKAWHVMYAKPLDNQLFGDDANDAALGVELCYGGKINFKIAYARYVNYFAYLCKKYSLDPKKHIIGHYRLDPERRTDPLNAFKKYGITWDQFIKDVQEDLKPAAPKPAPKPEVKPASKPKEEAKYMPEKAVVYYSLADFPAAERLAKRLKVSTFARSTAEKEQVAKEIIVCGGDTKGLKGNKFVNLSGPDFFSTVAKIGLYIDKL